jgi:RNA polymerase sigma-70 factor (ECF subfamily)
MAAHDSKLERLPAHRDRFATTHWSIVVSVTGSRSSAARRALATLCENYWFPLYAYVRRRGYQTHEAEDLTQEFFLRLLAKNYLADVDRQKGKFRAFLLASLKHFLANEWDRQRTQKRGGGQTVVPLDAPNAESRYRLEPADAMTPEKLFERRWALTVLDKVLVRLQAEFLVLHEDGTAFDGLKQFLTAGGERAGYAEVAAKLGMTEGALRVAVHRLRRRYRQLLRDEIAQTVASPEEIDDEIHYLLSCL